MAVTSPTVVLEDSSGGWTATEVDPAVTSDVGLIDGAGQSRLARHRARPVGVIAQAAVVLATAAAVGLAVFFLIRSAATSDAGEEQAQVYDEVPTVGLDVDDGDSASGDGSSGFSSSRTGSKRDTLEDGVPDGSDDGDDVPLAMASTSDDAAPAGPSTEDEQSGEDGAGDPEDQTEDSTGDPTGDSDAPNPADPAPPTTQPDQDPLPATSAPPTTAEPTTTIATTTVPVPTSTTTAQTTTTTIPPTTTTSQPTVSTLAIPLIAAPGDGSVHTWEEAVQFEANSITDADQYCWKVESIGDTDQVCNAGTSYALPGGEAGINPGPVTVTATAKGADGDVLRTETISLTVLARDIIKSPDPGEEYERGDVVRVRFEEIPGASDFCVTLRQGSIVLPTNCDNDDRVNVRLRQFESGSVTVQTEVRRGSQVIGRQTILINYNAS